MASLVADYDSNNSDVSESCDKSDSDEGKLDYRESKSGNVYYEAGSEEDSSEEEQEQRKTPGGTVKLPGPDFAKTSSANASSVSDGCSRGETFGFDAASVFANPFLAAEKAKTSALERHVKMTASADDHPRTINGRQVCWNYRKGRCRFGHNCKFAHDSDLALASREKQQSTVTKSPSTKPIEEEEEGGEGKKWTQQKRKKPGLSNTLVPPKRSLKAFQKQRKQEQSWLPTLQ